MRIEQIVYDRGYRVHPLGFLLNPKNKLIASNNKVNYDYLNSSIRVNGVQKTFFTHRLQAYQKYGSEIYKAGIVVRHLDGNPKNNSWQNILIGTQFDNMADRSPEDRMRCALIATSKVRKYDRSKVKEFYNSCFSYAKTMKKFGISSKGTLHFILNK